MRECYCMTGNRIITTVSRPNELPHLSTRTDTHTHTHAVTQAYRELEGGAGIQVCLFHDFIDLLGQHKRLANASPLEQEQAKTQTE